jgi:hypothetical protein
MLHLPTFMGAFSGGVFFQFGSVLYQNRELNPRFGDKILSRKSPVTATFGTRLTTISKLFDFRAQLFEGTPIKACLASLNFVVACLCYSMAQRDRAAISRSLPGT